MPSCAAGFPSNCRNAMREECHDGSWFWKDLQLELVGRSYWRVGKRPKGEVTKQRSSGRRSRVPTAGKRGGAAESTG